MVCLYILGHVFKRGKEKISIDFAIKGSKKSICLENIYFLKSQVDAKPQGNCLVEKQTININKLRQQTQ